LSFSLQTFAILSLERHRWRIGYRARRACSRLLVRDPVVSNQRLYHSIGICCFSDKHAALMSKNKASSKRTSLSSHSLTQSRFVHTCLRKTNTFTYMCMFNSINKILTVYKHFSPPFLQLSAVVQSAIWLLIFILTSSHVVPIVLEYISKSCMCLTK
jgi:hypothetical protein